MIATSVSLTPKVMTMSEFDKAVEKLRGKVVRKSVPKRKRDCTPLEWAGNLDYQKHMGRVRRRRSKKTRVVAKPPVIVKMPDPKPLPQPPVKQETVMMFLKMAKHLAAGNEPLIEVLTMVEKLVGMN